MADLLLIHEEGEKLELKRTQLIARLLKLESALSEELKDVRRMLKLYELNDPASQPMKTTRE